MSPLRDISAGKIRVFNELLFKVILQTSRWDLSTFKAGLKTILYSSAKDELSQRAGLQAGTELVWYLCIFL